VSADCDEREPCSQLYGDALAKITKLFGEHLADVLEIHRRIEDTTGATDSIGRQNLVEAFAHLAVLFERAPELSRDDQLEQVAYLRDHLRRVMMESFERDVYAALGVMWDPSPGEGSLPPVGRLYDEHAAPLINKGKLLGHVSPKDAKARLDQIASNVLRNRKYKNADGEWPVWKGAAQDLEAAAKETRDLQRDMGAAVDAAMTLNSTRKLWWWSIVASAAAGVALTELVRFLGAG
jgi:hypothetical protein